MSKVSHTQEKGYTFQGTDFVEDTFWKNVLKSGCQTISIPVIIPKSKYVPKPYYTRVCAAFIERSI